MQTLMLSPASRYIAGAVLLTIVGIEFGGWLEEPLGWVARIGTPAAAALISAGFFFSSMGRGEVTKPNRLIWLVWLGALSLAAGVVTLGLGLLTAS